VGNDDRQTYAQVTAGASAIRDLDRSAALIDRTLAGTHIQGG
jgi:hypothetical protein